MNPNTQSLTKDHNSTIKHPLLLTCATGLFFLCGTVIYGHAATDNTTLLKSVAITDAAGTNAPPTAVINYTKNGDMFTFDASQSSDSDGSIASYKWKFSDGSIAEGPTWSYTSLNNTPILGQLMVTDTAGAVTLAQVQVENSTVILKDSFSEVSQILLANHSPDIGGAWHIIDKSQQLSLTTGNKMQNINTDGTLFYNESSPNSADYSVSAHVFINNTNYDRIAGPCLRLTNKGYGYCAYLKGNGEFVLSKQTGGSIYGSKLAYKASTTNPQTTDYIISIDASKTTLVATIKEVNGTSIASLKSTDSEYQDQGYAGGIIRRNNSYIYNIEAK